MKKFHHSQSLRQIKGGFFSLLLLVAFANCTGELPLSDLINNTITLKVMGTYESNNPYSQNNTLPKDDVIAAFTTASPGLNGTLLQTYANGITAAQLKYYIDIAEIRLARGQGKSSSQTISDYWAQFAIDRQLMCSDYDTADGRLLSNCRDQNGQGRLQEFFNGGFTYPAVDVPYGNFNHLGIYFRRFVTSPAARYDGTGTTQTLFTAAFDNRTIYGFDMESLLQNPYGTTSTEPLMFPLQRKDLSLNIVHDNEPYVMEVRVFLQNLMMVHVLQATNNASVPSDSSNAAVVYVGPADWNVNHAFNDLTNATRMGGSVLMTARTYQPAKVGSLQMNATFTPTTNASYFVAVTAGSTFDPKTALPLLATAATNNTISNVQPGTYDVYRTCDVTKCMNTSTAGTCDATSNAPDGFPETAQLCQAGLTVSTGTPTAVTTAACAVIANCN
jgi:hypothetical protein